MLRRDKDEGVKRAMEYKLEGKGVAGRPRRTWHEIIRRISGTWVYARRTPWIGRNGGGLSE